MRILGAPPARVVESGGLIRTGSFSGPLPRVDLTPLGKSAVYRLRHHKRWVYLAIASPTLFVGLNVVDLGYAKNAFGFVYRNGRLIADRTALGHPLSGGVADGINDGLVANFSAGATHVFVERVGTTLSVNAGFPDVVLRVQIDAAVKHRPLSAIGPIPQGTVNATEKHALLPVTGELIVAGESIPLADAVAGWDYTNGLLARHTRWNWAYLMGRATSGERIAMNLVEGFLGEQECGVWIDDELHPIGEGRFSFDRAAPMKRWSIATEDRAVNLTFAPGAIHHEKKNLRLVRSNFLQPIGAFSGTIAVADRTLTLESVLGVTEDQDVLW
jgi:hypothetical protein